LDARCSWRLVTDMMRKYNKEKPIVFNIYNCIVGIVWIIWKVAWSGKEEGFIIGMKLVRGFTWKRTC
jgi:proline dehydrogenase